jgi:hypothetical protein
MSRNPNPARTLRAPMAWNPGCVRVRRRGIAARHPHPTAAAPVPVALRPHHRGAGRRWNRLPLQRRRWGGRPAISRTGESPRLTRVARRLARTGIARWRILLGCRWGQRGQQRPQGRQIAGPTQRSDGPLLYRSNSHRVGVLPLSSSSAGSCRVVSCPRTGSAMACSRLCAPFHLAEGRTFPSLPI